MEVIDRTIPNRFTPGTNGAPRGRTPPRGTSRIALESWNSIVPKRFRLRRLAPFQPGLPRPEIPGFSAGLRVDVVGVTVSTAPAIKVGIDSFEEALANAEWDDEPLTDDERIAVEAGLEAYRRGEFMPLPDVLRWLEDEETGSATAS